MSDRNLAAIFNECIDQLAAGQTIEECLRRYPAHANVLRPMLEAGELVKRAQTLNGEAVQAEQRVRERLLRELNETDRDGLILLLPRRQNKELLRLVAIWLTIFLCIVSSGAGGAYLASELGLLDDDNSEGQEDIPRTATATATPTATSTPTMTPTSTATMTASPTPTLPATATFDLTANGSLPTPPIGSTGTLSSNNESPMPRNTVNPFATLSIPLVPSRTSTATSSPNAVQWPATSTLPSLLTSIARTRTALPVIPPPVTLPAMPTYAPPIPTVPTTPPIAPPPIPTLPPIPPVPPPFIPPVPTLPPFPTLPMFP
jgi:hypothetical protein